MPAVGAISHYSSNTRICDSRHNRKRTKNVEYLAQFAPLVYSLRPH